MYTNFDLLCSSRHRYPPWSSIANGSDDTMTGVIHKVTSLVILLATTIPSMIIQHSYDEQLTSSHKETHELEKNCAMLQGNIAFYLFNLYARYKYFGVCPTVEMTIRAISCLYETVHPSSNRFGTGNNMQIDPVL